MQILKDLERGDVQVVVNVAVLTEGFDAPPISCIVLTRPCSYKSTMVQMIGRGLRTISQEEYPGLIKKDCVVLDFGTSVLTHGSLDESVDLDGDQQTKQGATPLKVCPDVNQRYHYQVVNVLFVAMSLVLIIKKHLKTLL